MSIHLRELLMRELSALRHEPIDKRIRGVLGDATVIDSTGALLVWEPRRVVPDYAVPEADVHAEIVPAPDGSSDVAGHGVEAMGAPGWATASCSTRACPSTCAPPRGRRWCCATTDARRRVPAGRPRARRLLDRRLPGRRRVVRGGRAQRRPSARPVPPDRHRPQPPATSASSTAGRCWRSRAPRTCCSSRRCRCATTSRPRTST